jgi:hypothetical protein
MRFASCWEVHGNKGSLRDGIHRPRRLRLFQVIRCHAINHEPVEPPVCDQNVLPSVAIIAG